MLFESFSITLAYRERYYDLDLKEVHSLDGPRKFEVIQGGIGILIMVFENTNWSTCVVDDLPPVVKQDTEVFVSQELIELLIQAIVNYYDCFTERKILKHRN